MPHAGRRSYVKRIRTRVALASALAVFIVLAVATRTHAVQEWYHTVSLQGRVTMWLLDEDARVNGLLLDEGSQVRFSPQLADAIVQRVKAGDTVSVTGRSGQRSPFGRLVRATSLGINGQTLTIVDERPPARRPGPHHQQPPPPPGAPPAPPVADAAPTPAPPTPPGLSTPSASPQPTPPVPPAAAPDAARDAAIPPAPVGPVPVENRSATVRGTAQAFLVGERGEIVGLALNSGEQVRMPPPVGEAIGSQVSSGSHPAVAVEGEVLRGAYGAIVRPTQLTIGTQTFLIQSAAMRPRPDPAPARR
jgi:hypothetical protein